MTPEQKQRAMQMLRRFSQATPMTRTADNAAVAMAALLQEMVDAPEPEPFGYFKSEPFGWTDCAETDDGAIALYTAPSEPKPVARVTGYYAGYLSIATVDGRVLPAGTALYTATPIRAPPRNGQHASAERAGCGACNCPKRAARGRELCNQKESPGAENS